MPSFSIVRGPVGAPKPKPQPKKLELVGRSVLLSANPTAGRLSEIVGVVKARDGYQLTIALGIPNSDGVLVTSKDASLVVGMDEVTELDAVTMLNGDVREWKTQSPIQGVKAASSIRDADNRVIDYKDVSFEGYGSTFQSTTPADREGDYILPTAFDKSLRRFRQNPVMLVDHQRRVSHLMGHYSSVSVNERGLALRGEVTNSTHWDARHVRFSIMEESLKTLSIGGYFFYLEDYHGVQEIDLHECSLVVIPANPDANFIVRSLAADAAAKALALHLERNGGELRFKTA